MNATIDLTGLTLLDIYGLERQELAGEFSINELTDLFIDSWVPLYECHKCGRSDYCKFARPVAPGSSRMEEIQCGVVVTVLRNFVRKIWPTLDKQDREAAQGFLDASFHFSQFVFNAEVHVGSAMNDSYLAWMGDSSPVLFGVIMNLREHLNKMAASTQKLSQLFARRGLIFVEGESEKAFVERLRLSRLNWFLDVDVDTYHGEGNRQPKRIEMMLSRFVAGGYEAFIQGDADGGDPNIFSTLISKGLVKSEHAFSFTYDFETSVPHRLALIALKSLNLLSTISQDEYEQMMDNSAVSFGAKLKRAFGIDIDNFKVEFAEAVANEINWGSYNNRYWLNDEEFMESELGRFLLFIRQVH